MGLIDWSIVFGLLLLLTATSLFTRKYTRSVADFLAANRCVGRYLLCVSEGIAALGAISIIAVFEMFYNGGFSIVWWGFMLLGVTYAMFLSGWVFYRFRQTRALTLAQFLEVRYSKKFRIFAGIVCWLSGIINFGIFPAVGARFFIYFCDLPDTLICYALVMIILLAFSYLFIFLGGQIAVLITDFIQGTFTSIMFIVIVIASLSIFSWPQISEALLMAPQEESLLHPFSTQETPDFNIWFCLILSFLGLYQCGIWQGAGAYNASALNAHEARMGKILATWRDIALNIFIMLMAVCAYTSLHHPDFALLAERARAIFATIQNPQVQKQMTTPIAMRTFLPPGVMGCFAALMLAAAISTFNSYMHSWGSILVQDVIMPFRKKLFTPRQHIRLLRLSIFGVVVFVFCFSLIFRQTEYILMFFQITGAIFMGGAGAAVIGGLYWKRGTTAAAWSAMITGSTLAVSAVVIHQIHATAPFTGKIMSYIASKNGLVLTFYASALAVIVYILVSLLGSRKTTYNIDRMLYRGKYAIEEDQTTDSLVPTRGLKAMIGISNEFTGMDKIIYLATIGWAVLWTVVFVAGTIYNLIFDVDTSRWIIFWRWYLWICLAVLLVKTVWFTCGGLRDLKRMFGLLTTKKRNDLDDGMVVDHHNLGENAPVGTANDQDEKLIN